MRVPEAACRGLWVCGDESEVVDEDGA